MRWFDCDIYKAFIYNKLLTDKAMKTRSFRLSVDIPLECSFGDSVHSDIFGRIVQLSKDGALVKFSKSSDIGKLESHRDIIFKANFSPFGRAKNKEVEEMEKIFTEKVFTRKGRALTKFRLRDNIVSLGNNKVNFNFTGDSEAYLFFSFDDLLDIGKNDIRKSIVEVVNSFEEYADKYLESDIAC